MAIMGRYCKAFTTESFRQFPAWRVLDISSETAPEMPEYFFLHEGLHVTSGIFTDEQIVFNEITPEWESFCHDVLGFAVPSEVLE